jgi:hypothetical protein
MMVVGIRPLSFLIGQENFQGREKEGHIVLAGLAVAARAIVIKHKRLRIWRQWFFVRHVAGTLPARLAATVHNRAVEHKLIELSGKLFDFR